MKDILKGVLVVLVTLALWGVACNVKAGDARELRELMQGKTEHYNGTCALGAKSGLFEEDPTVTRVVHDCTVYVDMGEPGEIYYVLIQDRRKRPHRLIKVDKDNKTQEEIWTSRQMV